MILLLLACVRNEPDSKSTPAATLSWGDLHVHSGLSMDGCETPENWCLPAGTIPGEVAVEAAADAGLDFFALTDHAEYDEWAMVDGSAQAEIWAAQQAIAEASGVIVLLGYEYTVDWGHRTVILEADAACTDWRKRGEEIKTYKDAAGLETYTPGTSSGYTDAAGFEAGMDAVSCDLQRWASWRHHSAYTIPVPGDWTNPAEHIGTDTVMEIASEHGSSECQDPTADGCDYHYNEVGYSGLGSAQTALVEGLELGFVGGSDRHDSRSWSRDREPSYSGHFLDLDGDGTEETPAQQSFTGAITGVIHTGDLDRGVIFDAIEARHTIASSWNFDTLRIVGEVDGDEVWPGDTVSGTVSVTVELEDSALESWSWEIVDPITNTTSTDATFDLAAGDVRYVRIRAWAGGVEQRAWASPFFGG